MTLDFSRCRSVWVPSEDGGFWSPPPPHVRFGVEQIIAHPFFLLADDMGGMKTAQAIIAAQFLHDMDAIDRVIVITPASVRSKVWFDQDLGQLHDQVFEDKRNIVSEFHQKIRQWAHGPEAAPPLKWIITNYEFIRKADNLQTLLAYCGPKTFLVLDESNAVRSWDSAQTKACMTLRWKSTKTGAPSLGIPRCGRILEMNGTPVAETPLDLFSQGNLLHPSILDCKYITHYKGRYAIQEPVLGYGGKPIKKVVKGGREIVIQQTTGWTNLDDLQRRFAPYVLRREAKDLGIDFALPPVGLEVVLTKETWRAYCDMRDELCVWLEKDVATASTAAVKVMRLAQITSGFLGGIEDQNIGEWNEEPGLNLDGTYGRPILADVYEMIDKLKTDKVENPYTLGDIETAKVQPGAKAVHKFGGIKDIGREKLDFALAWHAGLLERDPNLKLLTWCRFVPELRRYLSEAARLLPSAAIGAACGESVLGLPVKAEREHALRLLHPRTAPEGPALVGATQGTGALGLNFTACRTVLDMSYDFSPWKKKQGDSRVNRPGQTGPVSFFYLIAVGPKGQKTIDHHIMMSRLGKMNVNDFTTSAWVKILREE